MVEIDESDDQEEARIARYLAGGCSCQHGPKEYSMPQAIFGSTVQGAA